MVMLYENKIETVPKELKALKAVYDPARIDVSKSAYGGLILTSNKTPSMRKRTKVDQR